MSLLADLNARYTDTAFRLEVRQHYAGGEHGRRSIHDDPYLRRIAEHVQAGKRRDRVHVVAWPLSGYVRFELDAYRDNVTAGERVLIAPVTAETAELGPDFWLFDEDSDHPEGVIVHYDDEGAVREREHVIDPRRIAGLRAQAAAARANAVPLDQYLASLAGPGDRRAG
jgi:hypothetical protein